MKHKMLAVVLALTVMSWAQTATQTAPSTPQAPADNAKCSCCEKMAASNAKDAHACCAHHDMQAQAKDSKEMASCCAAKDAGSCCGKDAKSCVKNDNDKAAASCCGNSCDKGKTTAAKCSNKCAKDGEKGCCSSPKKTAENCRGNENRS